MIAKGCTSGRLVVVAMLAAVGLGWTGVGASIAAAQMATPGSDPCVAILAEGSPTASEGAQGESVFSPNSPEQSGAVGNPADYPFDLVFIDAMTLHHLSTVAMAEIALVHGGRQEVRDLAAEIVAGQGTEVDQLQAWREAWYPGADLTPANVTTGLADEGMMQSGATGGMGQGTIAVDFAQAIAGLCQPEEPFDLAFIQAMTPLQQGAVGMAHLALARAQHEELKTLAGGVVTRQEEEIAKMLAWEAEWYPSGVGTPAA